MANDGARKRFLCRLGFHSLWMDAALYSRAQRCEFCDYVECSKALRQLERERVVWSHNPSAYKSMVTRREIWLRTKLSPDSWMHCYDSVAHIELSDDHAGICDICGGYFSPRPFGANATKKA